MILIYLLSLCQLLFAVPAMSHPDAPDAAQPLRQGANARLTHKETINRTLTFPSQNRANQLVLKNVLGRVAVQAYDGEKINIRVEKTIEARTQADLQLGIEEIQLATKVEDTMLYAYMDAPFVQVSFSRGKMRYNMNHDDDSYTFRMDFTVQVPRHLNLDVSAVSEGDMLIEGVQAEHITVHHVNGAIVCQNISGQILAETVNGNLDISFAKAPAGDNTFKTINGTITLLTPEDLSADVSFKSMNGDFYTNYASLQYLPASVEKEQRSNGAKSTYRIDQRTQLRIGRGGPILSMETLNGEAYLKFNE